MNLNNFLNCLSVIIPILNSATLRKVGEYLDRNPKENKDLRKLINALFEDKDTSDLFDYSWDKEKLHFVENKLQVASVTTEYGFYYREILSHFKEKNLWTPEFSWENFPFKNIMVDSLREAGRLEDKFIAENKICFK